MIKKNLRFELIRALACLTVILGHLRIGLPYFKSADYDFLQIITSWGKEAVLIFFILSGIVISLTTDPSKGRRIYFKKRALRVLPTFYTALFVTYIIYVVIFQKSIPYNILLGNLLFLGTEPGFIISTFPLNTPVWSLSFEVFFYLLFGILLGQKLKRNILLWSLLSTVSIIYISLKSYNQSGWINHFLYMFNYSFLWLLGYFLFTYKHLIKANLPCAIMGLSMIPMASRLQLLPTDIRFLLCGLYLIPLFTYCINYQASKYFFHLRQWHLFAFYLLNSLLLFYFSTSLFSNKVIYIILPIFSFLFYWQPFISMIKVLYQRSAHFFSRISSISFALYLVHMPIMYLTSYLFTDVIKGVLFFILITPGVAYLIDITLQRAVIKLFQKRALL